MPLLTSALIGLAALPALLVVMESIRPGSTLRAIETYLDVFSRLAARNPAYVRLEHREIVHSIRAAYDEHRGAGDSHIVATTIAIFEHFGELQPVALARKTHADDQAAAGHSRTTGYNSLPAITEIRVDARKDASMSHPLRTWKWRAVALAGIALAIVPLLASGELWKVAFLGMSLAAGFATGRYTGIGTDK